MKPLILFFTLVFALNLPAQEIDADSNQMPMGSLLRRAPKFSQWIIHYRSAPLKKGASETQEKSPDAQSGSFQPSKPVKIVVTKTGHIFHTVIFYENGKYDDVWYNGKMRAVRPAETTSFSVGAPLKAYAGGPPIDINNPQNIDYDKIDFQDLDWISLKTYVGSKKQFLIFRDPGSNRVAYIDADTRLPVRLQIGHEVRDYQFQEIPQTMQTFPAEVTQVIDEIQKKVQALTSWGPRPF